MLPSTLTRGSRTFRLGVALFLAILPLASAWARVHHNDNWARQQFAKAERMREALNGRPAGERTRREYQRVIDSYRRGYFCSPSLSKAAPHAVPAARPIIEVTLRIYRNKIMHRRAHHF